MTGAQKDDIWAFVHVEFLFGVPEGERKGSKEFPRRPPKAFSDDLAFQIRDIIMTPTSIPDVPFASAVVDAPLIRVYNFLLLLSLSYQLEILIFQATQLLLHGWKDHLKLSVAINRKSFTVQYWVRQPASSGFPAGIPQPPSLPWFGGEVTISIVPAIDPRKSTVASAPRPFDLTSGIGSSTRVPNTPINPQQVSVERDFRSPADRIKAQMERRLKLRGATAVSDEVDHCKFEVQWKPQPNALGQVLVPSALDHSGLEIDSDCLDFEALLTKVLRRHADAIMEKHLENAKTLATSEGAILFPHPDEIMLTRQGEGKAIRVQLSGNQFIVISMDAESGRYIVNESGDLGGATRG
ncbi:mediator complex subunit, partial [Serendipita sp. 399]